MPTFLLHDQPAQAEQTSAAETNSPVIPAPTALTFNDFDLHPAVEAAVVAAGYVQPSDVQAQVIPEMLAGRDILAQSQTGSGKTAAFALPALSRMDSNLRAPQVLVLTPTRELAIQVAASFETYGKDLKSLRVATIYGGQGYDTQLSQLKHGSQIVVGTPGRLIDHLKRGTLKLDKLTCLVLDEADEMLNMGFSEDVRYVLDQCPAERQVALFSATMPAPIRKIAQQYLNDPARVSITAGGTSAASIRQRAVFVAARDKIEVLARFLEFETTDGVIVFTKTKDATVSVAEQLNRLGLSAVALNGDMPQKNRERTIERFKAGDLDVLVATDVAARGLDVSRVSHVFNFDLPHDPQSYVHRIGRTGRAGRSGEAIIFVGHSQRSKLSLLEKTTGKSIEVVRCPSADEINQARIERFKLSITKMAASEDLTLFTQLVQDYAEESGMPLERVAAALAQIAQRGQPFLARETSSKPRREYEGNSPRESYGSKPRGKFAEKRTGPPRDGMQRYRIEVGYRDGVKPGNIVGAIANEAGIDGKAIGPISIHSAFSTIDLPAGMPAAIFNTLRNTRVAGKQLRLSQGEQGEQGTPDGKGKRIKQSQVKRSAAAPHAGKVKKRKNKVKPS
ncbi:DEAD/DEAH box helicase [Planctomycetaceae bacterium SH139]